MTTCRHPTVAVTEFNDSLLYSCDGCQEMGYGSMYQCTNGCDYGLHQECITASEVAHHHFFERRPFTLQLQQFPKSSNLCTACGIAVTGWRYYHPLGNGSYIFLHPCCMKMPHCIETDEGDRLCLKQQLMSLQCGFCQRTTLEGPVKGWAYVSADQELVGHVRCMKNKKYEDYWRMYGNTEAYYVSQPNYNQQQQHYKPAKTGPKGPSYWKLAKAAAQLFVDPVSGLAGIIDVFDMLD